jgi:hypothetical protein
VLFVPKKVDPVTGEKTWRMCISYVKLNSKTLNRIAYRLPRVSDLLVRVSAAKIFSKLDLLSGFYQVRMRESDIPKTGFVTPYGNFEFKVMPMGLCGAPSTFQYLMDSVFREPLQIGNSTLSAESFWPFIWMIYVFSVKMLQNMSSICVRFLVAYDFTSCM